MRQSASGALIEAKGVSRHFGSHVALDDVTLTVERGETFGLLGANGAGKTTFIRLLTGYLIPTSGEVRIDGISPARNPRAIQERLGFAAETALLYPQLRVRGHLDFAAGVRGLRGVEKAAAVDRALEQFQLREVAGRLVGNLSKGFQQRVFLATSFLHDPPLLIIDEPTGGLDPLQRSDVRDVLSQMRGQRTVLLCTHDLEEARELTSRVAVLYRGRLVAIGPTQELLGSDQSLGFFRGEALDHSGRLSDGANEVRP